MGARSRMTGRGANSRATKGRTMADTKADKGTARTMDLGSALAVFQAGVAAYEKFKTTDGTVPAAASALTEFLDTLIERGVTLADLVEIIKTVTPLASMFVKGQKRSG